MYNSRPAAKNCRKKLNKNANDFSNSRREHVDRNSDAGTSAELNDSIMLEYLHINISTMEQIVASSVAESVLEDNIANSHDPRHLCL